LLSVQAFGGAFDDTIYGDAGQDIILGDFGHYDAQQEFLPWQNYVSNIHYPDLAGEDVIYGGPDDDVLMGQEVRRRIDLLPDKEPGFVCPVSLTLLMHFFSKS